MLDNNVKTVTVVQKLNGSIVELQTMYARARAHTHT